MLVLDSVAKLFNTGLVSLRSGTNGVYRYESNGTVALIAIVSYFNAFSGRSNHGRLRSDVMPEN